MKAIIRPETEMKDSGDVYIGKIPLNWRVASYKYFADSGMGLTILKDEVSTSGVPIYSATQDRSIFGYISNPKLKLNQGDLVIPARGNSIGCTTYVEDDVATCTQTTIYSKISGINSKFLFYCSIGLKEKWFFYVQTAIPQITVAQVQNNKIPMPLLSEQQAIAEYLDKICFKIDETIAEAKASIDEYKKLKQSVIFEAVTKGLDKTVEMKPCSIFNLNYIPKHWQECRIGTVYQESKETGREDLPILMVSINTGISEGEVGDEERVRKVVRSDDKSIYKVVHRNDLVYNMMRAWQGGFGAAQVDGLVSPAYVVATPRGELDSRYIEALLRTPVFTEKIRGLSYGIADFRLRLYWPYFKNLKICLPPVEEQSEIADYITEKSKVIDGLIDEKIKLITDLEAYKKSLIYEVVTGKRRVV